MKVYRAIQETYRTWTVIMEDDETGDEREYYVRFDDSKENNWKCSCTAWIVSNGKLECKHIKLVKSMFGDSNDQ